MEKVENTETSQVYENDMELYLSQFCKDQKIEDIRQESQSVWNAALMYIKRHAFNDPDCLKSKEMHNIDGFLGGYSNYNAYNYKLINRICDYYIYMCMMYDKEVSAIGFSLLTGIDRYTIATWRDEGTKSSPLSSDIGKKISDFREESLSAKLATAKRNPGNTKSSLRMEPSGSIERAAEPQASVNCFGFATVRRCKWTKYINVDRFRSVWR